MLVVVVANVTGGGAVGWEIFPRVFLHFGGNRSRQQQSVLLILPGKKSVFFSFHSGIKTSRSFQVYIHTQTRKKEGFFDIFAEK